MPSSGMDEPNWGPVQRDIAWYQKKWGTFELRAMPWLNIMPGERASHKEHRVSELISPNEMSRRDKSIGTECWLVVARSWGGWNGGEPCTRVSLWGEGHVLKPGCTTLGFLEVPEFSPSNRWILRCINDASELSGDCSTGQRGASLSSWSWSWSWSERVSSYQCPKFNQSSSPYQYSQKYFWSLILKIRVK